MGGVSFLRPASRSICVPLAEGYAAFFTLPIHNFWLYLADEALKQCVARTLGDDISGHILGASMEIAVTTGGQPYFATHYRWGYGEDFRGTESLSTHVDEDA